MPRFRPRISLLSALLLMTIVGLTIVCMQLWQEVAPLRAEVRRLRDEVGYLLVDDPTKVHAIRVDTRDELLWKWRVWVPQGSVYVVSSQADGVPKEGFPEGSGAIWIREPGEHTIEYRIDRDRRNDESYGKMIAGGGSVGHNMQSWVNWGSRISTTGGVPTSTRSFEPGKPIELIRHRVSQASRSDPMEDPSAGFMIWMEPGN